MGKGAVAMLVAEASTGVCALNLPDGSFDFALLPYGFMKELFICITEMIMFDTVSNYFLKKLVSCSRVHKLIFD